MSLSINDLTAELLDLVSKMIDPTSVKILRATCSISDMSKMASLVIYQDQRYKAVKKIQRFWNNKRIPNDTDEYWSRIPWASLHDNHRIYEQYKRLLIAHYPIKYIQSMTRQLVGIRGLELDEGRCGSVTYWAILVRTSSNDQLFDLGW